MTLLRDVKKHNILSLKLSGKYENKTMNQITDVFLESFW